MGITTSRSEESMVIETIAGYAYIAVIVISLIVAIVVVIRGNV